MCFRYSQAPNLGQPRPAAPTCLICGKSNGTLCRAFRIIATLVLLSVPGLCFAQPWQSVAPWAVDAAASTASAQFLAEDTMTQGNWQGKYGTDGYYIANSSAQSLPGYAIFTPQNALLYTWASNTACLLYTSPSPRDRTRSRMPSSA